MSSPLQVLKEALGFERMEKMMAASAKPSASQEESGRAEAAPQVFLILESEPTVQKMPWTRDVVSLTDSSMHPWYLFLHVLQLCVKIPVARDG